MKKLWPLLLLVIPLHIRRIQQPVMVAAQIDTLQTQRVVVAYPDEWKRGALRNCWTQLPANDLPRLNCSFEADTTPWNAFVMDVHFSGKKLRFDQQAWTCQPSEESLTCKN